MYRQLCQITGMQVNHRRPNKDYEHLSQGLPCVIYLGGKAILGRVLPVNYAKPTCARALNNQPRLNRSY